MSEHPERSGERKISHNASRTVVNIGRLLTGHTTTDENGPKCGYNRLLCDNDESQVNHDGENLLTLAADL